MTEHPKKLAFLDGLRGLAALYVMIGHARWLLWEGHASYLAHPDHYGPFGKALVYLSTGFRFGHEAVIFFFVLSGFVIHLRYARRLVADPAARFDFWPYLARRARRLYPPLAAALAITFGADMLGRLLNLPTASGETLYPLINQTVGADHTPAVLARNLAFIMDPVFGSDGPLWSLNDEWYFYLLYPLVFILTRRSWRMASLSLVGLSLVGFAPGWPQPLLWLRGVFQLMIVWWFGALLADRVAGRLAFDTRKLALLLLAFAAIPLWRWGGVTRDIVVGLGFTGLIAACLAAQERGRSLPLLSRLAPLGGMSYTLYVIHFPLLFLGSGCLMRARGGPLPETFAWAALGVGACLVVGWLLHFAVERPFVGARRAPRVAPPAIG